MSFKMEQLNALAIKKQCLAGVDMDVKSLASRLCGLHATSPTTPYLSLFARLNNFSISDLDEELYVKRTMGRLRCVRKTVYIFPVEFMPVAYMATKRVMGTHTMDFCRYMGVADGDYEELSKRALELLKAGPMTTLQLRKALGTGLHVSSVLNVMCDEAVLARGKPVGWRSNQYAYYPFEDYYPGVRLDSVPERDAIIKLIKRYLSVFGPVTEDDIAWWTGLNKKDVREALEGLGEDVAAEGNMAILGPDLDTLIKAKKPRGRVVNLLPSLDPYLMGYKERDRYLDKEFNGYVFDRGGNATSTIVVDGRVAGVWDIEGALVKLFFFREAGKDAVALVKAKARAMGNFVTGRDCGVAMCDSMTPLAQRTAGGVMSPLRDRSDL